MVIVLLLGAVAFVCMFIAALIGAFSGTSDCCTYGGAGHDIVEPMYKYPSMSENGNEQHEIPAEKTDSHFMEKVTYVGAMKKVWKDHD